MLIINPNDAVFVSLSQRMMLQNVAPAAATNDLYKNEVPYDLFCPKIGHKITKRVCKSCGIYYPAIIRQQL